MGPRLGRTTQFSRSQAQISSANLPPPSSLAAQIADRLLPAHQTAKRQDLDSFRLLLGEILDGSDHIWDTDGISGGDATVNSRLICIIAQAGLRSVNERSENPERSSTNSAWNKDEDSHQSLQAIDLILSRSPTAPFQPLELDFASGFPLFAWLIPKILSEVGGCELYDSDKLVRDIIHRSLFFAEQAKTRSQNASQVASYVWGLIAGTYILMRLGSDTTELSRSIL